MRPLVAALRNAVEAEGVANRLAPKTSVIVDGGGALHLDAIDADLRLVATSGGRFHLAVGGTATTARPLGAVTADDALTAALTVLRMIADLGPAARGRDLDAAEVAAAVGAAPGRRLHAGPPLAGGAHRPPSPPRRHRRRRRWPALRPDRRGDPRPRWSTPRETSAPIAFAPAEGRALLAIGIARDSVARFRDRAAGLGFIVRPDDPRRSVVACAGAPACAAGLMPARAIAAELAHAAAPDARRLAHPPHLRLRQGLRPSPCRGADLRRRQERGAGLVVSGRAGDTATAHLPPGDLPASVARLAAVISAMRHRRRDAPPTWSPASAQTASHAHLLREPADA